ALERREPADHDLPGDEDRAAVVRADERAGGRAVRIGRHRLQVPGSEGADAEPLLPQFRVTVFVAGATGFVGTAIVRELRVRGIPVRALVRDMRRGEQLASWGAEPVVGDVTDAASLPAAVNGCTHVIHLVAIIRGHASEFERVMSQGTRNVLGA